MAASLIQWQDWVVATETTWIPKVKVLNHLTFYSKSLLNLVLGKNIPKIKKG